MVLMGYVIWEFLDKVTMERGTQIVVVPLFINTVMMFMPMMFSFMVKYDTFYKCIRLCSFPLNANIYLLFIFNVLTSI